ncbi:MAG: type IV secretory system conjugative DNA transfer family protein [Lachnospiraceae bacterium]|nr:type IV secretory system conjugative DNA transfer family protein [Lachnospiraceae bacterium]
MGEEKRKIMIMSVPFLCIGYFFDKLSWLYRQTNAELLPAWRCMATIQYMDRAFSNLFPSLQFTDLMVGFIFSALVFLVFYFRQKNKKKYRTGEEYGSARWGTSKDIKPFMHPDFFQNMILAKDIGLTMGKPTKPKYARNKNCLVVGGSGSGKTRFVIKPNLMQMNCSYVVTDPKGTVLEEVGKMLNRGTKKEGEGKHFEPYRIKVFNVVDFSKSMHYNPFRYIRSEKDILKFVTTLINNTRGDGEKAGEDFWIKAERLLYLAYIGYIWYEAPEEEQNFRTLLYMINASRTSESDESYKNAIDLIFEDLEAVNPDHFAVRQYKKFKLAAGKTAKSILISCGARLAPFDIEAMLELTDYDELELELLGDRKTALFVIISDTDATFNFIVSIMYTQMFDLLCDRAYEKYGGSLPIHVRCLLDEFANSGQIPQFEKLIATLRSRGISVTIVLQAKAQLKAIYKDNADTIIGNCDSEIFLGGKEGTTLKEVSEMLGKETIDISNTSDTRGTSRSYGINNQKNGKELMSKDELAVMDGEDCIVQVRGVRPFKVKKFDIEKHPRYHLLSDYNKNNRFRVRDYLSGALDVTKYASCNAEVSEITLP